MPRGSRKPKRPRPNATVVALLEVWLQHAREGEVQGIFLLGVHPSGQWSACYQVPDEGDLLVELRTSSIQVENGLHEPVATVH